MIGRFRNALYNAIGTLDDKEPVTLDCQVRGATADLDRALIVVCRDFGNLNTQTDLARIGTTVVRCGTGTECECL